MFFLHINAPAVRNNIITIRTRTKNKFCAVVKANAYGHGLELCKYIDDLVDCYAVAWSCEAEALCNYTSKDIYVLNSDYDIGKKNIIYSAATKKDLLHKRICVKINTGMNRNGIYPQEFNDFIARRPLYTEIESVYTHFCSVEYAKKQFEAFDALNFPVKHCCASNCMVLPTKYFKDMVRVGLAMYGYDYSLSPCMSVKAAISAVLSVKKGEHIGYGNFLAPVDMKIAVLEAGYADGLRRCENFFEVGGTVCKTVGSICMDVCMVDVSECELVPKQAIFIGDRLKIDDVAKRYGTIPYEVLTAFNGRNRRMYATD